MGSETAVSNGCELRIYSHQILSSARLGKQGETSVSPYLLDRWYAKSNRITLDKAMTAGRLHAGAKLSG